MMHLVVITLLWLANTVFVGRAVYLIKADREPRFIDFWSRRLASLLWPVSIITAFLTPGVPPLHRYLLLSPALLIIVFMFYRPLKKQHPLLHPLLHYFCLTIAYFLLIAVLLP